MIRAIIACDDVGGIGKDGSMPWPRNRRDLAHFKKLTTNSVVVMGRGTWEAKDMPTPLPNRENVLVTRESSLTVQGVQCIYNDVESQVRALASKKPVFIIGGANLFHQLVDIVDVFHLTRISGNWHCDVKIDLDVVDKKFILLDSVNVDDATCFETYLSRRLYDLSFSSNIQ